jgi:glyoxylase-like metal-dependent hydrolase (beta-lactamase superfamily II)
VIATDDGELVAVHTPGHTRDHLCFHWRPRRALFAGDMLLGKGDTTWVAEYPGCVADYLASIARLRRLDIATVYPAHGPPIMDPVEALDRYEAHRLARIAQVRDALGERPDADVETLLGIVYGAALPESMRRAARTSLSALVDYVRAHPD